MSAKRMDKNQLPKAIKKLKKENDALIQLINDLFFENHIGEIVSYDNEPNKIIQDRLRKYIYIYG